jgi:hypothetical protein
VRVLKSWQPPEKRDVDYGRAYQKMLTEKRDGNEFNVKESGMTCCRLQYGLRDRSGLLHGIEKVNLPGVSYNNNRGVNMMRHSLNMPI